MDTSLEIDCSEKIVLCINLSVVILLRASVDAMMTQDCVVRVLRTQAQQPFAREGIHARVQ